MFQTDLIVDYTDGVQKMFRDVHPDCSFSILNGSLTFETADGEKIHYIPADQIRNFFTVCVRSNG